MFMLLFYKYIRGTGQDWALGHKHLHLSNCKFNSLISFPFSVTMRYNIELLRVGGNIFVRKLVTDIFRCSKHFLLVTT